MTTRNNKAKVNAPLNAESPATSSGMPIYLLNYLEKKFDDQQAAFYKRIKESEDMLVQRFSAIEAEVSNLRTELKSVKHKVANNIKRCDALDFELTQLKRVISSLESEKFATDVIISNIPNNINADDAFTKIVSVLQGECIKAHKVFRTRSIVNAKDSVPIIVKLHSPADRSRLFRALAEQRKKLKRHYKLSDFGFSGDENLLINECLSTLNREIMKNAIHLKRSKLLHSVFALRGYVFVRVRPDETAIKIISIDALNKAVTSFDNKSSSK